MACRSRWRCWSATSSATNRCTCRTWSTATARVVTSCTTPSVSPKVPADVPVDVLTSARTFSGGEELAYDLQALGRARVVGETTAWRRPPARGLRPHARTSSCTCPIARSVNAVTGTNWEGVGVVPDVACPADEALSRAVGAR